MDDCVSSRRAFVPATIYAPEVWQALHTMIRAAVVTGKEQPVIAPSASVRRIR